MLSPGLLQLIVGQTCLHASMAGMRMAAPLMALRAGQSEAAVGLLLALFALTQVFLALPAGRFADRHGFRRPMGLSVVVATVGALLAVVWPVFPVLCLSALMTGGATGAAIIALQRHVGRLATGATQLKQVFSWLAIGPALSNFVGPLVAGLVIDHGGFQMSFAAMAALPVLGWLWVRGSNETPTTATVSTHEPTTAWSLLNEQGFRRVLIVNWFLASCWDVHTFVVPILGHERGLSASAIGTILGSFAIAAAAVRLVLPLIASRLREWMVVTSAMSASAVLLALYPMFSSPWTMGVCSVILGTVLGTVQPMIMSMMHQITPPQRQGEAIGLRMMAINASSVLMPMVFGALGAAIGVAGVFWATAAYVGLGSRMAWQLRHHTEDGHQDPSVNP